MAKGFRHGSGGELRKVPVLNDACPQDVSVDAAGTSVTFSAVIAEAGKPNEYTYQWYYDGNAQSGATSASYTRSAQIGTHTVYCIVTNAAGSVISRTATVKAARYYVVKDGAFQVSGHSAGSGVSLSGNKVSFSSGSMGGGYYFQVDLTNYKTVTINIPYSLSYYKNMRIGIFTTSHSEVAIKGSYGTQYNSASGTCSGNIDASSLKGKYCIGVYASSGAGGNTASATFNTIALVP